MISYGTLELRLRRAVRAGVSRCSPTFSSATVDPKAFDERSFVDVKGDSCIIPPNAFALASTVEYFRIPRDVLTLCVGKSTYARCGIIVNVTPLEPEWEGHVTLEFSNTTNLPAKIYANEGVAQLLFFQSDEPCEGDLQGPRRQIPGTAGRHLAPGIAGLPEGCSGRGHHELAAGRRRSIRHDASDDD